jgi:phosphopantetheinyl transferase (holo-ACP synthase)
MEIEIKQWPGRRADRSWCAFVNGALLRTSAGHARFFATKEAAAKAAKAGP